MLQTFIADALIHRQVETLGARLGQFIGRLCGLGVRILRFLICGVQRHRTAQQNQCDHPERVFHSHLAYSSKKRKAQSSRIAASTKSPGRFGGQLQSDLSQKPCLSDSSAVLAGLPTILGTRTEGPFWEGKKHICDLNHSLSPAIFLESTSFPGVVSIMAT